MTKYIDKGKIEEILRNLWKTDDGSNSEHRICYNKALQEVQCEIDNLEVKEAKESVDAFIEKANEFIWSHTEGSDYHVNYVLKEFENFMKGE